MITKTNWGTTFPLLAFLMIGGWPGPALAGKPTSPAPQLLVGDTAPPISLDSISNRTDVGPLSWQVLHDKFVVVEFWGTWCGGCIVTIPHLNALYQEFHPRGVEFLSVTFEDPALVQRFTRHQPIRAWIGHDIDRSMIRAWNITEWPTVFVIHNRMILARLEPKDLTITVLERLISASGSEAEMIAEGEHLKTPPADADNDTDLLVRMQVDRIPEYRDDDEHKILALRSHSVRNIVSRLWGLPPFQVIGDEWIDREAYEILLQSGVPHDYQQEVTKRLVSTSIGFSVESRPICELNGWRLTTANGAARLPPAVGEKAGWAIDFDARGNPVVAGSAMSLNDLASALSLISGVPFVNEIKSDDKYFVNLTIDGALGKFLRQLREQYGLHATRGPITLPCVRVERSH